MDNFLRKNKNDPIAQCATRCLTEVQDKMSSDSEDVKNETEAAASMEKNSFMDISEVISEVPEKFGNDEGGAGKIEIKNSTLNGKDCEILETDCERSLKDSNYTSEMSSKDNEKAYANNPRISDKNDDCESSICIMNTTIDENLCMPTIMTLPSEEKWPYDDPAKWPLITETLREYYVHYKPNQNMDKLDSSKRMIGKKERLCSENNFFRIKKNGETIKRDWLIYSPSSQSVFCYICKLYSCSEQALCKDGASDWQNICKRLESHENSVCHRSSVFSFSQRCSSVRRIDNSLVEQYKSECDYWRKILHRVVAVIKFISQRGLAFYGENETLNSVHNGIFLGILELLSTFDEFLANHLKAFGNKGKGHVNYLSSTTVSELIDVMSKKVLKEIVTEIQEAKYFGLIIDSTPDICHVDQLAIVIRYVDGEGQPVERFIKFVPIHGHNAEHLHDVVTDILKNLQIELKFCRGQSYDNASNMAGKYSGLQARFKQDFPLIEYVPCAAHSLNLVGVNAAECCQTAVSFFGLVQSLYNFFSVSTHRWELLHGKLLKQIGGLTLKSLSGTRWSANADAVKALRKGYTIITHILYEISQNSMETVTTKHEARSLFLKLKTFETALMIIIWDVILQRMNSVSKTLQSISCEMTTIVPLYVSLECFLNHVRSEFDKYENEALELVDEKKYTTTRKRKFPKNRMLDESETVDVQLTDRERFIYQTHYVICDSILVHLARRKAAYVFLESRFGFMYSKDMSTTSMSEAAKLFQKVYSDDVGEEFADEILQFYNFLPQNIKVSESLKTIKSLKIVHTFPNVEIGLRILNSIPISNCTSERSFSALKRIKHRLRSKLSEKNLSGLALLSIESDMTEKVSFDDVIEEFALLKARKKPMHLKTI